MGASSLIMPPSTDKTRRRGRRAGTAYSLGISGNSVPELEPVPASVPLSVMVIVPVPDVVVVSVIVIVPDSVPLEVVEPVFIEVDVGGPAMGPDTEGGTVGGS